VKLGLDMVFAHNCD